MCLKATEGWFENGISSDPEEARMYYFEKEKVFYSYRGPTFQGLYEGKGIIEGNDGSYFECMFKCGEATGFGVHYSKNETRYANYRKDK
jgi:hypothetical protein